MSMKLKSGVCFIYLLGALGCMQAIHAQEPGFTPDPPPEGSDPGAPPDVDPGLPPDTDVPPLPDEEPAIAFFGPDLFIFPGEVPGTDQWYFSFTFKSIHHFTGNNWFYFEEFDAYLWVDVNSGSLGSGFWAYMIHPQHASWVYLSRDGNFYDLRDSNEDGQNNLSDNQAGAQVLSGYLFLLHAVPGDPAGSGWYYFESFPNGNWMINLAIPSPTGDDWFQLR